MMVERLLLYQPPPPRHRVVVDEDGHRRIRVTTDQNYSPLLAALETAQHHQTRKMQNQKRNEKEDSTKNSCLHLLDIPRNPRTTTGQC